MENTSDMIEAYLKKRLAEAKAREIEIKRSELAEYFSVVPSQINYVIKTRFNPAQGFDVESKRGGGGYIRIVKVQYSNEHDLFLDLYKQLNSAISCQNLREVLQLLADEKIISLREGQLIFSILSSEELTDKMRCHLLHNFLKRLDRMD
ncbi:MAG: CtsR family transcriptional regulator [Lactovum sp.]